MEAKRAAEFEHEKATRAKAQEDYASWRAQRDIRLNAKKESNRSEEQVLLEALESEVFSIFHYLYFLKGYSNVHF